MFSQTRSVRPPRSGSSRKRANTPHSPQEVFLRAMILSFCAGVCFCGVCFLLFAWVLSHTAIPLMMVPPFACLTAAASAAVSGFVLGRKMSRQYLLCGIGCGIFYAVCQLAAAFLANGNRALQGSGLMLPIALLLGGTLGGALAALKAVH